MSLEFKAFPKMERFGKARMTITQKIHGSNAQIHIFETEDGSLDLMTGSRNRWIYPGDDNYGFAAFVHANKLEFIEKLGCGTHFGEWAGPGINSGEGLAEKTFVLFDHWKFTIERPLPPKCVVVPILFEGEFDLQTINEVMSDLKTNGSKLAPGFMRPEGIVITTFGSRFKKVFEAEETQWTKSSGMKAPKDPSLNQDYSHLLQPIRLEKLLSRDETYVREYPKSLGSIVKAYFEDLVAEGQVTGDEGVIKGIRKNASTDIFQFVKQTVEEMQ